MRLVMFASITVVASRGLPYAAPVMELPNKIGQKIHQKNTRKMPSILLFSPHAFWLVSNYVRVPSLTPSSRVQTRFFLFVPLYWLGGQLPLYAPPKAYPTKVPKQLEHNFFSATRDSTCFFFPLVWRFGDNNRQVLPLFPFT